MTVEPPYVSVMSIPVSDQDRARDFYVSVLGFNVEMDQEFGPAQRWVMLRPPGGGTAITLVTWFDQMPAGSLSGTVLSVADLETTLADLVAKGVVDAGTEPESAPWGRWVTIADPDGNGWVIQQDARW
jgi:catechol 2,3-dioxygenase-like lactoylglutathione lyase family enzyme